MRLTANNVLIPNPGAVLAQAMEDADRHYRVKLDTAEKEFNELSADATKLKENLAESNALMMQAVQEAKTNAENAAR